MVRFDRKALGVGVAQETGTSPLARDGDSQVGGEQSEDLRAELIRNRKALMASMALLEGALARPSARDTDAWVSEVASSLDVLREEFLRHTEVHEGADSFHDEILTSQPHLAPRVAKLQREHVSANAIISELQAALLKGRTAGVPTTVATAIRTMGSDLLMLLVRHRQSGADLVWESVNLDLGSGE